MKVGSLFASSYRWIEYLAFGRALERSRMVHMHRLAGARRILVLGEGDGRTLLSLLKSAPFASIDVVDSSAAMIRLAEARTRESRATFHQADLMTIDFAPKSYDAVVTNFFLDCFPEEEARVSIERIATALVPCGLWVMTDFSIPESGWRRIHAQLWIRVMYWFFGLATGLQTQALPPIPELLLQAGLQQIQKVESRAGLISSELWRNCHRDSN